MIDPVCGMEVSEATAAAAWEHDGVTYLFCSTSCYETFRADPAGALARDPSDRRM